MGSEPLCGVCAGPVASMRSAWGPRTLHSRTPATRRDPADPEASSRGEKKPLGTLPRERGRRCRVHGDPPTAPSGAGPSRAAPAAQRPPLFPARPRPVCASHNRIVYGAGAQKNPAKKEPSVPRGPGLGRGFFGHFSPPSAQRWVGGAERPRGPGLVPPSSLIRGQRGVK